MKLYSNVSVVFLLWALAVFAVSYFGFLSFPHADDSSDFLKRLAIWDGGHYVQIAEFGYREKFQYAFFPLYPALINLLTKLIGNFTTSGVLISLLSTFLALHIFYRLITIDYGKQNAQKTLLALLFFPMSFYFLTSYTEGLFFLLSVLTFLSIRKNNFFLATLASAFASATRITGLGLAITLIVYVYLSGGFKKNNWFVLFAPLGFIAYSFYLYSNTGDPLYFIKAQSHFWNQGLVFPGSVLFHSFKQIITPNFLLNNFRDLLDLLFACFGIIMLWRVLKKLSIDYVLYSFFAFVLPLFSPTLAAFPRYLLTIFPIFLAFSFYKNTYITFFYQVICLMLSSVYTILFINGYWTS